MYPAESRVIARYPALLMSSFDRWGMLMGIDYLHVDQVALFKQCSKIIGNEASPSHLFEKFLRKTLYSILGDDITPLQDRVLSAQNLRHGNRK